VRLDDVLGVLPMNARIVLFLAFLFACGSHGFGDGHDASSDVAQDDVHVSFGDASLGDGGACSLSCSSDLHDVLDCHGNVVQACPPDQGCGGGKCVSACASADANKSTIGCDYWLWPPEIISIGKGACFAAFVANTWNDPVTISIDRGGQSLPVTGAARIPSGTGLSLTYAPLPNGQLPPGEVAIVFLARNGQALTSCPAGVTPAYTQTAASIDGTGIGTAFHLSTDRPVVAYDIFPYGGGQSAATSATLLIPTSAWDTNYVGVDAYKASTVVPNATPSMAILASQDGTQVTISPTAPIVGGTGVAPTGKGQPITYALSRGQFLQLSQPTELTGSAIQSNNPIAVFGGASCLNIDVGMLACDSAHQQIPPVKALGSEYVAIRYRNRMNGEETPPWRMVGAVDGTTLTYEPAAPAGAPTTLSSGQLVEFQSSGQFVVKSQDAQHPFYLSAHMTGGQLFGGRGDPEFVNVIPPAQYLASYVFFTDPTYPETELLLVRKQNGADVTLDCAGAVSGWQPIASSTYEYARVDLVTGNFQKIGNCDNGRHEISSTDPFGLVVWGWGTAAATFQSQYVSYAYPGGASVQPINTVVVPPNPK
jgi:hypothetical protein